MSESEVLALDPEREVSLREVWEVAVRGREPELSGRAAGKMREARRRLEGWVDEGRTIYGVTTGFGPLADEAIEASERRELQKKLVYHLSTGVGKPMSRRVVRAMTTARAVSLSRGRSAIRPETLERLLALMRCDLRPEIPAIGTVGASGDLTPLAHLALALIGEGTFLRDGDRIPAAEALEEAGIEPVELAEKEGLALVNGTSAMTGIAVLNGVESARACAAALRVGLFAAELLGGRAGAWDPELGDVRPHPGQQLVHRRLGDWAASSGRLVRERVDRRTGDGNPQDPYTLRCLPQIYGAVADAVWQHNEVVRRELNAVTDNPIVADDRDGVLHGGNFYGQHVAFASDHLANAARKVGVHLERCVARLTDDSRNGTLPPFLRGGRPGLDSGLMGVQVTASSLVAEMRTRSTPASTQSISTNAANQDVVTMGTTAARRTADHLDRLWELIAIAAMTCAQGLELAEESGDVSDSSRQLASEVREVSPPLEEDRPLSGEIRELADHLRDRERGAVPHQRPG